MSICCALDPAIFLTHRESFNSFHQSPQSPSNATFSVCSTPIDILLDLPPEHSTAMKVTSSDGQAALSNGQSTTIGSPEESTQPYTLQSPISSLGLCSPIPGLLSLSPMPSKKTAEDKCAPPLVTHPIKPDSRTSMSTRPQKTPNDPVAHDVERRDNDEKVLFGQPGAISRGNPNLKLARASLGLMLSPESPRSRDQNLREDFLLTPINGNIEQLPPITPLYLLDESIGLGSSRDAKNLFDGDLSDIESITATEPLRSRNRRQHFPFPISTKVTSLPRTPESRQLPTPSSLSPPGRYHYPIRIYSYQSIVPMYLPNQVRDMIYDREVAAQERPIAKNTQLRRIGREGRVRGHLAGVVSLRCVPAGPIKPAALNSALSNAFAALRLREP